MFSSQSRQIPFVCEICEKLIVNALTIGIESDQKIQFTGSTLPRLWRGGS